MKAPADGATWGINLCRDQQTPVKEISSWAIVEDGFHNPSQFGRLLFDRNGAAVRVLSVGPKGGNRAALSVEIEAGKDAVELSATPRSADVIQASPTTVRGFLDLDLATLFTPWYPISSFPEYIYLENWASLHLFFQK